MYILMQNLLVVGLLINIALIGLFVFRLFIRRNVLMRSDTVQLIVSICTLIILFAVCLAYIAIYQSEKLAERFGIDILVFQVIIIAAFTWFFSYLRGVEACSMEVLQAIVAVIEAGDPNLDGHSIFVQKLAMLMYNYLPWRYRLSINPYNLEYASLLLDVGKLGIPKSIIQKDGKLEKDEWEFMRRHPGIGVKILRPIASCSTILSWIKYHHERVDGGGYYHLEGDEIPAASRIIAIADTYSAITMERSYKASLSYEEAVSELKLAAGSQLDPEFVKIFCSIPLRKIEACMAAVHKIMKRYDEENFR